LRGLLVIVPCHSVDRALKLVTLPQGLHFLLGHEFCRAIFLFVVRVGLPFIATFHGYHSFVLVFRLDPGTPAAKRLHSATNIVLRTPTGMTECMFVDATGAIRR
jgi:hypothetical protein